MTKHVERPPSKGDAFIETIIQKLGTGFAKPEEIIIQQDDDSDYIYYISSGDCSVNIRDRFR